MAVWVWVLYAVGTVAGGLVLAGLVRAFFRMQEVRGEQTHQGEDSESTAFLPVVPEAVTDESFPRGTAEYLQPRDEVKAAATEVIDKARQIKPISAPPLPVVAERVRVIPREGEHTPTNWALMALTGEVPKVARRRLVTVVDELGSWEPWAHESEQPQIMGDVLSWRKWKTIRPQHVGMGAL